MGTRATGNRKKKLRSRKRRGRKEASHAVANEEESVGSVDSGNDGHDDTDTEVVKDTLMSQGPGVDASNDTSKDALTRKGSVTQQSAGNHDTSQSDPPTTLQTQNRFDLLTEKTDSHELTDRGIKRAATHDGNGPSDDGHQSKKVKNTIEDWEIANHKKKKVKKPAIQFLQGGKLKGMVKVGDLRDLVLYLQANGPAPQWTAVDHKKNIDKVVVIWVPGLEEAMFKPNVDLATFDENCTSSKPQNFLTSFDDYYPRSLKAEQLPIALQPFANMFSHLWPIKAPGHSGEARMYSPAVTFLTVPFRKAKHGGPKPPPGHEVIPVTVKDLLHSEETLCNNNYPSHPVWLPPDEREKWRPQKGFVATNVSSIERSAIPEDQILPGSMTDGRTVLAMDCEMVHAGDDELALARISIVNWDGETVLDEYVQPPEPVKNYKTEFSGITEDHLRGVKTTLPDIQRKLLEIITPTTILVGHSLESDFGVLKLAHPFIIDTSIIYPHPQDGRKHSLKYLAQTHLRRTIQKGGNDGHDSVEDAKACLDLVRMKCRNGKDYGTFEGSGENLYHRLARGVKPDANTEGKTSAAVECGNPRKGFGRQATVAIPCRNDADVTREVIRAATGGNATGNEDTAKEDDAHMGDDGLKADASPKGDMNIEIPPGGVDFIWAQMRELDYFRGWSDSYKPQKSTDRGNGSPDIKRLNLNTKQASPSSLEDCITQLVGRLETMYQAFPRHTTFIIFSGTGDPREFNRIKHRKTTFIGEELRLGKSLEAAKGKWPDGDDKALREAFNKARNGIAFMTVK